jgi:S-adenosylmethionine hydrolase
MLLHDKQPTFAGGIISTQVVHNDRFGNVILNLEAGSDVAAKLHEGNLVKISIGKENNSAPLVKTYGEVEKGRLLLLYSSNGLLEISMNQGSAAKQLKVEPGASVFLKP